eukprot:1160939-Pelagomonas_calceolata.AAC.3
MTLEAEEESKWEEAAQQQLAANVGGGVEGRNWGGSKGRGLDKRIEGIAADRQVSIFLLLKSNTLKRRARCVLGGVCMRCCWCVKGIAADRLVSMFLPNESIALNLKV